ncbi:MULTISPECIES: electron transport complex subunit RsxG [Vibrio]|uniref:Ion-translocating oxidoreductase complex subunit G n=1 Tax=Vibrio casei TaxID=673372 RepID=A0A368LNP6_9VIBR|nr:MULTISPECIES: electron transport complex subunit RsxG [Vibrio]RCS73529.1 electron transport complex subunit RsxG [Vibrio casei]SJN26057.1 Electron transport complex protein RnfG [Vibrio casei]HBV77493.1 electron transport complex subunit RsxG [Vibrio sp.]
MLNAMKKNGGILAAFAVASTALVAITNWVTHDTITEQQQLDLQKTLNQVIPKSMHDNQLYASCMLLPSQTTVTKERMPAYLATKEGKPTAIAIETYAPDGYNGAIKIIVGLDMNGVITSTRVLAHNETPGLGDKIETRKGKWIFSFDQRTVTDDNQSEWAVRKDGGQFDQFTGATITPRAVVKAVKNTVLYFKQNKDRILSQPLNCEK